jgi:hypothetical protein
MLAIAIQYVDWASCNQRIVQQTIRVANRFEESLKLIP